MQTLIVHSAFWRGVSLFAGMLMGKLLHDSRHRVLVAREGADLVCWCSSARSRREDELARSRQAEAG
ncbi:hypothetical protein [Rhodanobacter sp. Root179]|uniref:hypothetical protein n=1 Tax=Rhodanobacter sp. Root179 TaxID=1736482 RepID=UPI0012FA1C49|nr:hypothetical protein [Rhodanobacter sp. Root179]